jgi:hypothetical protein
MESGKPMEDEEGFMPDARLDPIPREIATAFAWAVGAFSLSWSPDVREPTTLLYGQHFTISEICHLVDSFTDPLPETILEILYVARDSMGVDGSALKSNQTYQGGSRHLRQLMRARKEAYQRRGL